MSSLPRVVLMSLWRNDEHKQLKQRAEHLLSKTYPNRRYVWVVADSVDGTERILSEVVRDRIGSNIGVQIVHAYTGIAGEDGAPRFQRLSLTASVGLARVKHGDDYWVIHESDIVSPPDLIERFLATGKCPIAGWPVLEMAGQKMFYDTWAYRKDGAKFSNNPPYHPGYRPDELFQVDSVGTVWMMHGEDVLAGVRCAQWGAVELCDQLRARGRELWVDPTIEVVQPEALMTPHKHPKEEAE